MGFKGYLFHGILLELDHLHDIMAKKGQDFLHSLLSDHVAINIKIDQMAFVVAKSEGKLSFKGREGRSEITKIKRAQLDIYEDAIRHIESRPWQQLPDGIEVYLENFNEKLKALISYKQKPKNNLIISYAKMHGKIIPPDNDQNKQFADLLDVAPPPILFSGKLTNTQKKQLSEFASLSKEERIEKYPDSKTFLDFIMTLFIHPSELSWLKDDGYEGVVFYFGNDAIPAKLVNPMFTQELMAKKSQQSQLVQIISDVLHSTIATQLTPAVKSFIETSQFKSDDSQQLFIDFIAHLTREIIVSQGDAIQTKLAPYQYEALNNRFSNISYSLIPPYIKQLANKYWFTEEIFAGLLNLLQKPKIRIDLRAGLTKERKDLVNNMVQQLKDRRILNVDI